MHNGVCGGSKIYLHNTIFLFTCNWIVLQASFFTIYNSGECLMINSQLSRPNNHLGCIHA